MLVDALEGHRFGCVNAVAWNPRDPYMFASAGDDMKVRMYVLLRHDHFRCRPLLTLTRSWSNSNRKARTGSDGSSRLSLLRPTMDPAASLT